MISVANRIYVNPEYAEAFEQRFRDRAGLVDTMPASYPTTSCAQSMTVIVCSLYVRNSRQDFLNWVRSDAFIKGHAQSGTLPKEAFSRANVLEVHEVLQTQLGPTWNRNHTAVHSKCTKSGPSRWRVSARVALALHPTRM